MALKYTAITAVPWATPFWKMATTVNWTYQLNVKWFVPFWAICKIRKRVAKFARIPLNQCDAKMQNVAQEKHGSKLVNKVNVEHDSSATTTRRPAVQSPIKSDLETYTSNRRFMSDSSETDEDSVSEVSLISTVQRCFFLNWKQSYVRGRHVFQLSGALWTHVWDVSRPFHCLTNIRVVGPFKTQ